MRVKGIRIIIGFILIFILLNSSIVDVKAGTPSVNYDVHVTNVGWLNGYDDGEIGGTTGSGCAMQAIRISLNGVDGNIEYQTHLRDIGWTSFVRNGEVSGTEGQNRPIEAIKIRLSGEVTKLYDVYYRVYIQDVGWLGYVCNGQIAGSTGCALQIEAIEIKLVQKDTFSHTIGATISGYILSDGNVTTYDNIDGKTTGYIAPNDLCNIKNLYNSGWVKVLYPTSNGFKTAYTQTKNFFANLNMGAITRLGNNMTVYKNSDLQTKYGTVYGTDRIMIVGHSEANTQIIYPVSTNRYKVGWIKGIYHMDTDLEAVIPNGCYQIKSVIDENYVLDVYGADTNNGANIQVWSNGKGKNQCFEIKRQENGYYTITALHSNKVLDVDHGYSYNGANILQYEINGTGSDNQLWKIWKTKDGYYKFQSKSSGLFLDVSGGTVFNGNNVQIWEGNETNAQKFVLQSVSNNSPSVNVAMSTALYNSTKGYLSCGFDGYTTTKGRHEGIDFVKGYGSSVYSLTDGIVTRVTEGYNGSNGLSTIAIYSEFTGKTVIYLHSNPLDSLRVGQSIVKGQQIATEAWRGCSNSSGTHTHVEVRNGRQNSAVKSVNDYILENENPTSFWNSQGYLVK